MKLLFLVAVIAAVWVVEARRQCENNHECAAVIQCQAHEEHHCNLHDGRCECRDHVAGAPPGTCTDNDLSNCQCEHGGTPGCQHGHCHCNHH
ncbi:hypothetical protein SNE40_016451 [Patella caerulea]|uniref:Uncharacterized protein n=1 Tax=Patella caerulea TaxID=87958 RepID=A0AAN8JDA1_PATCE